MNKVYITQEDYVFEQLKECQENDLHYEIDNENARYLYKYIEDLQHQLEEKQKVIDDAIKYIKPLKIDYQPYELSDFETRKLLEILERNNND